MDEMIAVARGDHPMTLRQLFYQLVSRGVIAKTEQKYKGTVGRLLTKLRRDGTIPFPWVADNTRWMRKPRTYPSLESELYRTAETYRRSVWDNQDAYVVVWLEKDALAGVLCPVTEAWDVSLMVTRGYSSLTFLHNASEGIADVDKPTFLYYLGDHDPSGVDITRNVEKDIRAFAPDADITFERIAVTPRQIDELKLPTRPTKGSDSRAKTWGGESVEVDAIAPVILRRLVEDRITRHIDRRKYDRLMAVEEEEREIIRSLFRLDDDA
jgi:hypothetical protein